jgi:hypothetical protein
MSALLQPGTTKQLTLNLHAARLERIGHVLLPVLWPVHIVSTRYILRETDPVIHIHRSHRSQRTPGPGQRTEAADNG